MALGNEMPARRPRARTPSIDTDLAAGGSDEDPVRTALLSVARLIQEAGQSLWSDTGRAQCCMQQAVALLEDGPQIVAAEGRPGIRPDLCRLAPWQIARALRFVDENLSERITLQQMAATTRLSVSYFSRAFRATMGERPYTFITLRRICRARKLLLATEMPLADIALECGLADQARFSRVFRRHVGVSPAAWRKMHGDAPAAGAIPPAGSRLLGEIALDNYVEVLEKVTA